MISLLKLQKNIYASLIAAPLLMSKISGVYNHVSKDTKFPYIHIGNMSASDASTKTTKAVHVTSRIHIYSREQGTKEVLELLEIVKETCNYMQFMACLVRQNKDGITYQVELKFRMYIEGV